jgi:hypothetical protein
MSNPRDIDEVARELAKELAGAAPLPAFGSTARTVELMRHEFQPILAQALRDERRAVYADAQKALRGCCECGSLKSLADAPPEVHFYYCPVRYLDALTDRAAEVLGEDGDG